MKVTVVGIELKKKYDFVDRNSGERRVGHTNHMYVVDDLDENRAGSDGYKMVGSKIYDVKFRDNVDVSALLPGDHVNLYFDRFGNLDTFVPA